MPGPGEVVEGLREQFTFQNLAYVVDVSRGVAASAPTGPSVDSFEDKSALGTDLQSTHLSGTISVSGINVTTPIVLGRTQLTAGKIYRMTISWTDSGNIDGCFLRIYVPV